MPRLFFAVPLVLASVVAAGTLVAQNEKQPADPQRKDAAPKPASQRGPMMMCPMMAAMKDVKLHADSPILLRARAEQLGLSEEQQTELEQVAERARQQARDVLTAEQQRQLHDDPAEPLSMMEIARLLMKNGAESGQRMPMCPMCMRMMQRQNDRP